MAHLCLECEISDFRGKTIDYIYSKFIRHFWSQKDLQREHYEGMTSTCKTVNELGWTFTYFGDKFYFQYIFEEPSVGSKLLELNIKQIEKILKQYYLNINSAIQITTIEL